MKKSARTYSNVGHVQFPIYDSAYENIAELAPHQGGVLVVRVLVEDTTLQGNIPVEPGPPPTPDDVLVGCDVMTSKEAFEYFSETKKIVQNVLLGCIDWPGVRRINPMTVEFFHAKFDHLNAAGKRIYRSLEAQYPGCRLWLMTGLIRKTTTIDLLLQEAQKFGLSLQMLPKLPPVKQIICFECAQESKETIKPTQGARKLGWEKREKHWFCPQHASTELAQ